MYHVTRDTLVSVEKYIDFFRLICLQDITFFNENQYTVACGIVSTARIESGEKNVLLNQLIKEKVTTVHNGMLCLLCGKVIRQNSNIRRHFRDRHLHEGVHYNCPQCQKTYKSRNTFSSHISTMHRDWGKIDLHDFAIPASEI